MSWLLKTDCFLTFTNNNLKIDMHSLPLVESDLDRLLSANIRILLVDDQKTVRQIWQSHCADQSDLEIVGHAENGEIALTQVAALRPDIVLIDVEMPEMDGLATTQLICDRHPQTKVLVLSSYDHEDYIRKALRAGAKGYLLKTTPAPELVHAIRFIHKGYLQMGPGLFEKLETNGGEITLNSNSLTLKDERFSEHSALATQQPTAVTEQSWSNPTQELMDALPKVWTRGLLYALALCTSIVVPWAMFSKVDETGDAKGRLEPQQTPFTIKAQTAGTVTAVLAVEGQIVKAGQALLELDSTTLRSELQQAQAKLEGQQSRKIQLIQVKTALLTTLKTQELQNQAQSTEKQAQVDQAQESMNVGNRNAPLQEAEKLAQVQQAEAAVSSAQQKYRLAQGRSSKEVLEVQRYQQLAKQGGIPQIQVVEAERKADEAQQAQEQALAEIKQAQKRLKEQQSSYERLQQQTQSDRKQFQSRFGEQQNGLRRFQEAGKLTLLDTQKQIKDLEGQLTTLNSEIRQSQTQVQSLNRQISQRTIRATANGTLFQMPIKTAKDYVQPDQLIAQLAPEGSSLVLKAQIPTQDSGSLKVGLPVKLKFDAYRFQNFGIIPGRLAKISPSSRVVQTSQGQVEVFDLDIVLERTEVQSQGKRLPLTAGQTATAEVIVRQRRVIDFFIDPFRQLQNDGLKL
jgi:hemolysin D